jgi:hypothetical protein
MSQFDFKSFHMRGMNAESEAEKAAINKELKDFYEALSDEQKAVFNEELQSFLVKEYANLTALHNTMKGGAGSVN